MSTVLLVSSRRNAMSCLGMSMPDKLHHGRQSQAPHGPDDTLWWGTATKQLPITRHSIGPVRFWNNATSTLEQLANNTPRHATFSFETQEKKATQTAQQLGDATCSDHLAKQHLWQQGCTFLERCVPHVKTVACKASCKWQWRRRLPHCCRGGSIRLRMAFASDLAQQ